MELDKMQISRSLSQVFSEAELLSVSQVTLMQMVPRHHLRSKLSQCDAPGKPWVALTNERLQRRQINLVLII